MIAGNFQYKKFNFPCGEMHVKIQPHAPGAQWDANLEFDFKSNEELLELLLVCDALKRMGVKINQLKIPYVPFGRQDRVNVVGESFSLGVFASLVNGIGAQEIVVMDPHSDVTPALIRNCRVIKQHEIFAPFFRSKKNFYLISPDAGAFKKINALAMEVNCVGVIECSKKRNVKTGEISGARVHANNLFERDCYIVDDICDGGRTFIEVAKALKEINCGKITLMVTHGFFTKGLEVFDGLIDRIYTRNGRVK